MFRLFTAVIVLACGAMSLFAQQVKYVAPEPDQAMSSNQYRGQRFTVPAADSGTVNPHAIAVICTTRKGQHIAAAIDTVKPNDKQPDLIRLDFSGKGDFKNAPTIPLKTTTTNEYTESQFGPVTREIKSGDQTLPVLIQGWYYKRADSGYRYIGVNVTSALEAQVPFDSKTYIVRLINPLGTAAFGNRPVPTPSNGQPTWLQGGDTLIVGQNTGTSKAATGYYGHPVCVDGVWYNITLSEDQSQLKAEPAKLETGRLKIDQPRWSCLLISTQYCFRLTGDDSPFDVPVDTYTLAEFNVSAEHGVIAGGAIYGGKNEPVTVEAGKTTTLSLGAPLTANLLSKASRDGTVIFTLDLTDKAGHKVQARSPNPPKVTVVDAGGKTVYENTLEYG